MSLIILLQNIAKNIVYFVGNSCLSFNISALQHDKYTENFVGYVSVMSANAVIDP